MASVRKHGNKWQARVQRKGQPSISKSFHNYADALKWVRSVETQIDLGTYAPKPTLPTLSEVVKQYLSECTPSKKGAKQEVNRGRQIARQPIGALKLDKITGPVIAKYRDERLTVVSNNTVRLELALLSVVFEQCRKEWGYDVGNPVKQIRVPKPGRPRQRRLEAGEEDALLAACRASGARYLHAFVVLAIETGMRFGELARLRWENIDLVKRTAYLPVTKNGHDRLVPLSRRALSAIQSQPRSIDGRVFTVKPGSITSVFRDALARAQKASGQLDGLRFHDLRHEAVSRLLERGLNPIEVGMVSGHRTMSMLQRYAHLRAEDLIKRLG